MPFNIGPLELIIILVIALLILGPGKLPEVGASLGKSIREFRKATGEFDPTKPDAAQQATQLNAQAPSQPPAAQRHDQAKRCAQAGTQGAHDDQRPDGAQAACAEGR